MSFAADVKIELCKAVPRNSCCLKAECYGLLLFGRNFTPAEVSFTTESGAAARTAAQLTAEVTGAIAQVRSAVTRRGAGRVSATVAVRGGGESASVLAAFGHSGTELHLRVNRANMENECCLASFLRGAFLCCGTAVNPEKDYHIEFVAPRLHLAKDLLALLHETELDLQPALLERRGAYVAYVKGGERVADLLTYLGAPQAAMALIQARMLKEMRNNINRQTNFETANLDKTASASARQRRAIGAVLNTVGINKLPEDLQELAMLRWRCPEMSLRELAEGLTEPLSRSGLNHRLARLVEIGEKLIDDGVKNAHWEQ